MEKCPVCRNGSLIKSASFAGEETYCGDCRRIIVSATLGFKYAKEEPDPCKTEDGLPGFKGKGEKAVCHPYTNDEEKKEAEEKASESSWAFYHRRSASRFVNKLAFSKLAIDYFGGELPAVNTDDTDKNPDEPFTPTVDEPISDLEAATTDGGSQLGDLNKDNPLNSGTVSSKRKIADLVSELTHESMGNAFCTIHGQYDGCKPDQNLQ